MIETVHYAGLRSLSLGDSFNSLTRRLACNNQVVKYQSMHAYRVIKAACVPPILFTSFRDLVTCLDCRRYLLAQDVVQFAKAQAMNG